MIFHGPWSTINGRGHEQGMDPWRKTGAPGHTTKLDLFKLDFAIVFVEVPRARLLVKKNSLYTEPNGWWCTSWSQKEPNGSTSGSFKKSSFVACPGAPVFLQGSMTCLCLRPSWSMVHGPWSMVNGPWSMDHGPWSMFHGPWTTEISIFYDEKENAHNSTSVCPFELIPVRFCIIFREDSF